MKHFKMLKFIPEDKQPARGLLLNLLTLNRPPPPLSPAHPSLPADWSCSIYYNGSNAGFGHRDWVGLVMAKIAGDSHLITRILIIDLLYLLKSPNPIKPKVQHMHCSSSSQ